MNKLERCRAAKAYHDRGFNCGQSVMEAFRDMTGLTEDQSRRIATGLGGGFRCGNICGASYHPTLWNNGRHLPPLYHARSCSQEHTTYNLDDYHHHRFTLFTRLRNHYATYHCRSCINPCSLLA